MASRSRPASWSAQATADGIRYRLIAEAAPPGAQPVEPTLEEGYVALMRGQDATEQVCRP